MTQVVKIITGWSNPGGSTVAHINLTNLLNENGFDCTLFGPQEWHLDKCKSDMHINLRIKPDDIVITHFLRPMEIECKKHILYCHEKEFYDLKTMPELPWDLIVFVSNSQKAWHGINHPSVIIPPMVNKVEWTDPENSVAGVIGSIDENKQTHQSIARAVSHQFREVRLFGQITDMPYFNEKVAPYVNSGVAVLAGHEDDRAAMYGQLSRVYHSSRSETYGLVQAECKLSGIPFEGEKYDQEILTEEEQLKRWTNILK